MGGAATFVCARAAETQHKIAAANSQRSREIDSQVDFNVEVLWFINSAYPSDARDKAAFQRSTRAGINGKQERA
jgi:hypothetical protein